MMKFNISKRNEDSPSWLEEGGNRDPMKFVWTGIYPDFHNLWEARQGKT